ncbi:MAG TPA: hypothetical protein VFP84_20455 [Kofleriaceae bacterium]|nr:hypothetical protein [Kofleriaceae bacterium]
MTGMARWIVAAVLLGALSRAARADPLEVVLRDTPDAALAIARLHGQLADLYLEMAVDRAPIEAGLDAQLATAARLAAAHHARAVVWFVVRGGGVAVAIATPIDHRLFVREIPPAEPSSVAEAAAVAVRGALRAIGDGGTIGIEVPAAAVPTTTGLELAVGWQATLDGGADAGAQALAVRTSAVRGGWAASLAVSLGPALRREADVAPGLAVELSRSTIALGAERRLAGFALGAAAGVVLYHRTTAATTPDLAATPAVTTARLVVGPEARWAWRPGGGAIGLEAAAALDVVPGAPEPVVMRGGEIVSLGALRTLQPRFSLKLVVGLR